MKRTRDTKSPGRAVPASWRVLRVTAVLVLAAGVVAAVVEQPRGGRGGDGRAAGRPAPDQLLSAPPAATVPVPGAAAGPATGEGEPPDAVPIVAFVVEPLDGCSGRCDAATEVWAGEAGRAAGRAADAPEGFFDRFPRWSPDGRRLAFTRVQASTRQGEVYVADLTGDGFGRPRRLTSTGGAHGGAGCDGAHVVPVWAPDGRRIAFTCRRGSASTVFVAGVDDGDQREVDPSGAQEANPTWSSDGGSLAYDRTDMSKRFGAPGRREVWAVRVRQGSVGEHRALLAGDRAFVAPAWSPVANVIAATQLDERTLEAWLVILDVGTGRVDAVLPHPRHPVPAIASPAWAPSGRHLAVPLGDGLRSSWIVVVDVLTKATADASPREALAFAPSWSRDSRRLAFDLVDPRANAHNVMVATPSGLVPIEVPGAHTYDATVRPAP